MAGDWIKVELTTPDKPELVRMAEMLGIDDHDLLFAKCFRLWAWTDQHTTDGAELTVSDKFIDRLTTLPGFADALRKVGWLKGRESRLSIPNFDRHNGQTAKKRVIETEKKRRQRAPKEKERDSCPENVPAKKGQQRGPEKRREESKTLSIGEAAIPTRDEVITAAGMDGVAEQTAIEVFEYYSEAGWLNQHGKLKPWRFRMKRWQVKGQSINGKSTFRTNKPNASRNGEHNADASEYAGL